MGDIIALFSTGAYGYAMASNYNNNPIPGVVMVKEGKSAWMVKPQTYEQIIQNNVIPDFI
jgi:diaminopimelate decarboxylase